MNHVSSAGSWIHALRSLRSFRVMLCRSCVSFGNFNQYSESYVTSAM